MGGVLKDSRAEADNPNVPAGSCLHRDNEPSRMETVMDAVPHLRGKTG